MIYNIDNLYVNKFSLVRERSRMRKLRESAYYQCLIALGKNGIADKKLFKSSPPRNQKPHDLIHSKEHHARPLKIFLDYEKVLCSVVDGEERVNNLSYKQFLRLYENIRDKGFDYELEPKLAVKNKSGRFLLRDGQHRASILAFLAEEKGINEIEINEIEI
jgi:hypothetical protein